ncbi:carboxyl-terminal processing protease [Methylohalomonas lacus]|uniref:Carboxyl-terminal processing protease n=1 Tax=Methylohalomonas lacus TaxID=398773 RepID=A0AAE3L4J3_9GAMM|nr:S41 family peptidase [Methylohalomonas lacus]MCS3903938.1 carboxyl-terminal processing protease [Methylohalomonas lacus]
MNKLLPHRLALVLLALSLSPGLAAESDPNTETPAAEDAAEGVPLEDIRTFSEVFSRVKSDYVDDIGDKKLLENAIRGMLSGLDPHSAYLDRDAYEALQEGTTGEFGGLGIEVSMEDGLIKVIAPIDDTPAARAGVQAGDTIVRLDDTPVKGLSLGEAVDIMRGKPGSEINLTIVREGRDQPLKLTIERDIIKVKSVRSRMLEPGYGYLRLSQFQSNTTDEARAALEELRDSDDGELKGLILDLRNNPGGVLNAAVGISDLFLDSGLIVYTEGRGEENELRFSADSDDLLDGAPLIVLVNGGSASASEIVAGALQDQGRAIIMGEKTFGKGSVQTILPMNNNTALKLTTARYFTPSGRSIQANGIEPDIVIDRVRVAEREDSGDRISEADLSGHLENDAEASPEDGDTPTGIEAVDQAEDDSKPLATTDYELYEALNLLKGVVIMGKK